VVLASKEAHLITLTHVSALMILETVLFLTDNYPKIYSVIDSHSYNVPTEGYLGWIMESVDWFRLIQDNEYGNELKGFLKHG
jgi:hypothetical protein